MFLGGQVSYDLAYSKKGNLSDDSHLHYQELFDNYAFQTTAGKKIDLVNIKAPIVVLNFWASWCLPCEVEHPILMGLSKKSDFIIIGVNYKDTEEGSTEFLNEKGNPYDLVVIDDEGMMGIEMGLTGVPETFVVNEEGKIIYRIVGPINNENKF